ncbi:hypothetical protein GMA19_00991 [Paenibacillus polymyxa E681]|nr:hypothetical protein PPE_05320 [Paenibacillus polymyxa E681]QNV55839.1 hypothetical protein GE561_00992 [Paenibacillus polymyxa E681]QNV60675.1 hypothetical protein GMA19_00991 [Paenibacillus polymyxa E681]
MKYQGTTTARSKLHTLLGQDNLFSEQLAGIMKQVMTTGATFRELQKC